MRIDPATVRWSVPEEDRAAELARRGLVVLLHGRYGSEDSLAGFAGLFDGVVASPRGPVPLSDRFQWLEIRDELPAPEPVLAAVTDALVDWLDELGVPTAAFVGFSQGGAVAAELAVRHPDRAGAVVVANGFAASAARPDAAVPPPMLWLRGEDDDVVEDLVEPFRRWLPASALERVYPGLGHDITPGQLADAAAWLRGRLPGTREEHR